MKEIFYPFFKILFLACTINNITYSQNPNEIAKLKPLSPSGNNLFNTGIGMDPSPVPLNDFNKNETIKRTIRKFTPIKDQPDARWFKSSNGLLVAYFKIDDIETFIYYNEKGNCEFIMRYYNEEKLPGEVAHLVISTYADFSINQVTEVRKNNKIAYVVKMESKTLWKTVKVIDGKMEVTEEFSKR